MSLFRNPTAEYRGTPFWSWNCKLDLPQLLRQLGHFREMGFGGAHIHCRSGLDTPYLGKEFMNIVRACAAHAKKHGMLTWLYDEDRWPSGFAGGLVTKEPRFRARHLTFTMRPYSKGGKAEIIRYAGAHAGRSENGTLLARYAVQLGVDGSLASYRRLKDAEKASSRATVWYAYLETAEPTAWFNNLTYIDTLNRAAIERFIEVTHEVYKKAVGKEFGKSVPAIFTDEPQFSHKRMLWDAFEQTDVILPFTTDLPETFAAAYGMDLLDALPEVVWALPADAPSRERYAYHDHVAERFSAAFADTLGSWCRKNKIALTGHMMEEPTLWSQTSALGEAMRSYRAFDIPGIDMLCDAIELTTAKQAQSAARQFGCPGVMSELYGVTGWHFDFAGHKRQGDWQAALGVTVRVPHLAWVSMAGEAKRDYPAAISYQSPWYAEYSVVENHFSRLNTALTRGRPVVHVAVIHPVESYWLAFGAGRNAELEREQLESGFQELAKWLLFEGIDFDYVGESLLPGQKAANRRDAAKFQVGEMAYDVVVVPGLRTIRGTTLDRLEDFVNAGGNVIFAGRIPELVDAVASDRAVRLAARARHIEYSRADIVSALESVREVRIRTGIAGRWGEDLGPSQPFLHQLREDGRTRYLFVCNTDQQRPRLGSRIELQGDWQASRLDTLTGNRENVAAKYERGCTIIPWDCPAHGSLLLELQPGQRKTGASLLEPARTEIARLTGPVPVTLSEPNVLLLDQAEWRVNGGAWSPQEELLRAHNAVRHVFGLPPREGHVAQPWVDRKKDPVLGKVELRFRISSDVAVASPRLALEDAETTEIFLDGSKVKSKVAGYFTDESIKTVLLPDMAAGEHELILSIPFTRKRNLEWCYLLGDFGVRVMGRGARLVVPVRALEWGDFTHQGLPFYAGNVTYHCTLPQVKGPLAVEVSNFKGPTLRAALDGKDCGSLAFAPHRADLKSRGRGRFDLTLFGNRANAFGIVHYAHDRLKWYGPDAWRSTGANWTYEYRLQPMGILSAPRVLALTKQR